MSKYLFISPNERGMPRAISAVSQGVQRGVATVHVVTDLHHRSATRAAVDSELGGSDYVLYFGHGQTDALGTVQNRLVDSQNLLPSQTVVALACSSGASLAPSVYGPGSSGGFLGFDNVLIHPARRPSRANQAYESALLSFVGGGTISDLKEDLERELLDAANDYLSRRSPDALLCFAALRSNVAGLSTSGNVAARGQ